MPKLLRIVLVVLFVTTGGALMYAFALMLNVRFANEWATPALMILRFGPLALGLTAIYAAWRVWRGSMTGAIYGAAAALGLVVFVAFVLTLGEGMRR